MYYFHLILNLSHVTLYLLQQHKNNEKDDRRTYRDWSEMNAGTTSVLIVHSHEIAI